MKQLLMTLVLVGSVTLLTGCGCYNGGCGYVQQTTYTTCGGACGCGGCGVCNACGYGYGYNDWY